MQALAPTYKTFPEAESRLCIRSSVQGGDLLERSAQVLRVGRRVGVGHTAPSGPAGTGLWATSVIM